MGSREIEIKAEAVEADKVAMAENVDKLRCVSLVPSTTSTNFNYFRVTHTFKVHSYLLKLI